MLVITTSVFFSVSGQETVKDPFVNKRIIGGKQVAASQFPYHVAIRRKGQEHSYCGGSIIEDNWILTAAHCLKKERADNLTILVGTSDLRKPGMTVQIEKLVIHPEFSMSKFLMFSMSNDIALMKTKKSVLVRGTSKIKLARKNHDFVGSKAVVSGFGTVREGGYGSPNLMSTTVDILSDAYCQVVYLLGYKSDQMMCAGHLFGGQDSCQGDSGGPLVVKDEYEAVQAGVVSFGRGCGRLLVPGVYTRVSHYADWIDEQTRSN
jgi:secreted trypsin-like serine protease